MPSPLSVLREPLYRSRLAVVAFVSFVPGREEGGRGHGRWWQGRVDADDSWGREVDAGEAAGEGPREAGIRRSERCERIVAVIPVLIHRLER